MKGTLAPVDSARLLVTNDDQRADTGNEKKEKWGQPIRPPPDTRETREGENHWRRS
jgi:hypothetical protein